MSNSRLEKFIYAICGMEVDDLPTPLSRIEMLWNCLITGETPDFEPLSRNEKYLMAMLTDDVDALPEPASRSEKLLYKIATGETDLSDVPGYLSRYEELLKQLIESGGIGGTDFEYVLYTLNQPLSTLYSTAEAPVKSAILKGNTLVNLFNINDVKYYNNDKDHYIENDYIVLPVVNKRYNHIKIPKEKCSMFKPSTKYTLWVHMLENHTEDNGDGTTQQNGSFWLQSYDYSESIVKSSNNGFYGCRFENNETGIKSCVFETHDLETMATKTQGINFDLPCYYAKTGGIQKLAIVILEGEYSIDELPFNATFEGMQSVKMPVLSTCGKNLFGGETERGFIDWETGVNSNAWSDLRSVGYTEVIGGNKINIYVTNTGWLSPRIFEYDKAKKFIKSTGEYSVVLDNATKFVRFSIGGNTDVGGKSQVMLYYGEANSSTTYEPYKSNILTTTSKNLFDMNRPYDNLTDSQATVVQDTNQITVSSSAESGIYVNANFILDKDFFAGKTVTGSCLYESDEKDIGTVQITYQDGDGEYHYQWIRTPKTFTFPNSFIGDVMLSVSANNTGTPQSNTVTVKNIQLELGSTATPYEPYSEGVTLRGIGEVKDTLDGNTGELTQRIGEIVLDGSENWSGYSLSETYPDVFGAYIQRDDLKAGFKKVISSTLKTFDADHFPGSLNTNEEGITTSTAGVPYIKLSIKKEKLVTPNVTGLKQYLQQNPITVQYELAIPTVKTVVLSTLDQDGQPTKLKTFNDITHVSIEAEDLLPTVDLEVATKIEETLSSLPTLMNDISETQQLLNESIDDQAENINEVSTAITEIHNDIL